MKYFISMVISFFIFLNGPVYGAQLGFEFQNPCQSNETWKFNSENSQLSRISELDLALSFSEFLALAKHPQSPEQKAWAEYGLSRTFYQAGLLHLAHQGFVQVLRKSPVQGYEAIHEAALGCLDQLHRLVPSLEAEEGLALNSVLALRPSAYKNRYLVRELERLLSRARTEKGMIENILQGISVDSEEKKWAKALVSAKKQHYTAVVQSLHSWFEKSHLGKFPDFLATREDSIRILFARALYGMGDFDRAILVLRGVRKQSNELAHALSDLGWSALLAERYSDAVGVSASLQTGALRRVFTPESPMVMAMALNEICQFPEALKAAQIFRRRYESSYRWLEKWSQAGSPEGRLNLWQEAIRFIQRQPTGVPEAVASEWIRSPLFLSRQDEMSQIAKQKPRYVEFSKQGIKKQRELLRALRADLRQMVLDYRKWKKDAMPGAGLPDAVKARLESFQDDINRYGRLKIAGISWKRMVQASQGRMMVRKSTLQARIHQDLTRITQRMYAQLEDVTDNMQLVEVEIYSGASQDMVFRNSHPEQAEMMKKAKAAQNTGWSWGSVNWVSEDEGQEVWEDELGGLQARLEDRCSSQGTYAAAGGI